MKFVSKDESHEDKEKLYVHFTDQFLVKIVGAAVENFSLACGLTVILSLTMSS